MLVAKLIREDRMTFESKQVLKMGFLFSLFFIPFLFCLFVVAFGSLTIILIDDPVYATRSEPYGMGLVIMGLGAALFGKELFDAVQNWRWMRRRKSPRSPRLRS
jgi:hypothetical protein